MQPATLMAFYTNFATEFLHMVFTIRSVLKGILRRDQKVILASAPLHTQDTIANAMTHIQMLS